ncbi:hypothetical protein PTKU46_80170 [Paraburkholderia terrae]|uniref:hypothetical protein n=1 Tax=Paraburkholderia terrae TaxID=311230 RepID=UPI0030E1A458
METEFTNSFNLGRTNLRLALRLVSLAHEWQQHAGELQARRIERDIEALRREHEAVADAKNWSEINAATQAVMRDYLAASASLWQEGMNVAMRNQNAFGEAIADWLKNVQSAWTGEFQKTAGARKAAMPYGFNGFGQALQTPDQVASAPTTRARAAKGDQHAV